MFNPFENEGRNSPVPEFITRFEKDNTSNWEKLYTDSGQRNEVPEINGKYSDNERKFFQIKGKYIVCPVKSGLMLIDQKRAHERILFEKYIESLSRHKPVSQIELFPVVIEIEAADYSLLREIEGEMRSLGFVLQFRENNKVIIEGRPSDSALSDPKEMLDIMLEEYKSTRTGPSSGAKENLASAMAVASAIPYGKTLFQNEIEDLFDKLFACSAPNYSPKGKPVINIITLEELDGKFR